MIAVFIIAFALCLIGYILHTIFHALEYRGSKLAKSNTATNLLTMPISFGYICWIVMLFTDPMSIDIRSYIAIPLGLLIGLAGFALFLSSTIQKKGFDEVDYLVKKGVYSKLRHPMYVGTMLLHIGFPIATRSLLTLASSLIWVPILISWKYMEEKPLERKFGEEYVEYRKSTLF